MMHFLARDRKFVSTPDADMEDDQRWYYVLFTLSFGTLPSHSFSTIHLNLNWFQPFSIKIVYHFKSILAQNSSD